MYQRLTPLVRKGQGKCEQYENNVNKGLTFEFDDVKLMLALGKREC